MPEEKETVSFVLTGFGPFGGVPNNPSSELIKEIGQHISSDVSIRLSEAFIIETSRQAAQQAVSDLYERLKDKERTIVIHIGVDYKGTEFQIEKCAYNEASFRIPDERGDQPENECILTNCELGTALHTNLDVEDLIQTLSSSSSKPRGDAAAAVVVPSQDPGRFVCNYTYCCSLDKKEDNNSCLFLHVPKFDVVPKEDQLAFLVRLMRAIADQERRRPRSVVPSS